MWHEAHASSSSDQSAPQAGHRRSASEAELAAASASKMSPCVDQTSQAGTEKLSYVYDNFKWAHCDNFD